MQLNQVLCSKVHGHAVSCPEPNALADLGGVAPRFGQVVVDVFDGKTTIVARGDERYIGPYLVFKTFNGGYQWLLDPFAAPNHEHSPQLEVKAMEEAVLKAGGALKETPKNLQAVKEIKCALLSQFGSLMGLVVDAVTTNREDFNPSVRPFALLMRQAQQAINFCQSWHISSLRQLKTPQDLTVTFAEDGTSAEIQHTLPQQKT